MIKLARNLAHILKTYDFTQAAHNIRTYGFSTFLKNAITEISKGSSQSVEKEFKFPDSPIGLPEEWWDYGILRESISKMERSRIAEVRPKPLELESIDEKKLVSYAESLGFSENAAPQISIIIPVYNNIKFTIECLLSIRKHSEQLSYEVIIIDDCSTDESGEILPNIRGLIYVKNSENLGFLRSSNLGAKKARGKYVVFLNNDAQATFEWLRELINTFIEFKDVGAVGPKILFPDGRLQEAGVLINHDCTTSLIGYGDDPENPRYNYVKDVEYCSGACLALETEIFHELGGFNDELAPAYYEDVDLCLRIREKGLRVIYNPKAVIVHHLNVSSNSIGNTYKTQCITRNRQKICEKWQTRIDELNFIRLIAFYLPQFHPIPENDRWWGKGFTEWRNVAKAKPNYEGHYQPHLPADLGFYDLRLEEVMEEQAELAKRYGINGFCYYYYWFGGKRLLERPIERMLKTGKPDLPFCLCWANENWTRKWDGGANEMLMAQSHSEEDEILLIKDVMRYMQNKNYIRINGKPLFLVYRINLFPDIRRTVKVWRDTCRAEGVGEIYLAMVESFEHAAAKENPAEYGFDVSVEFPPHSSGASIQVPGKLFNASFKGVIRDYRKTVLNYAKKEVPGFVRFRTVMPSWDNTPRRQNDSHIFAYSTPGSYQAWLEFILKQTREQNFGDERLVFINAWNEWAEGAHLEPDQRYGHAYLQATADALRTLNITFSKEDQLEDVVSPLGEVKKNHETAVILHLYYPELWEEISAYLENLDGVFDLFVSIPNDVNFQPERIIEKYPHTYIYHCANRGRDIAPFLTIFSVIFPLQYKYILKIHTKRSQHRKDGDIWRQNLLSNLLGSPELVSQVKKILDSQNDVGIVAPRGHVQPSSFYWGFNVNKVEHLALISGIPYDGKEFRFVAGSMFWFKPLAFKPVISLHCTLNDFEPERGQIDGTLSHALERYFGLLMQSTGFQIVEVGSNDGEEAQNASLGYRFASPVTRKDCAKKGG